MKLGRQTASVTNWLMSGTKGQPAPEVGMGATILSWTDRHAATIVEVTTYRGDLAVAVQEDHAKRVDRNGMSECQTYEYTPDPTAPKSTWVFKAGVWRQTTVDHNGTRRLVPKGQGQGLRIGERDKYHDYSF